jgi:hypothetical protein
MIPNLRRRKPGEISTTGYSLATGIDTIPDNLMVSGRPRLIQKLAHQASAKVIDGQ